MLKELQCVDVNTIPLQGKTTQFYSGRATKDFVHISTLDSAMTYVELQLYQCINCILIPILILYVYKLNAMLCV